MGQQTGKESPRIFLLFSIILTWLDSAGQELMLTG